LITPTEIENNIIQLLNINGQVLDEWINVCPFVLNMEKYSGSMYFFIEQNASGIRREKYICQ